MVPRQFIVDISDCVKCSDVTGELFDGSKSQTFNGTANRLLKLKHVQVLPPKPEKVCPINVLPKRQILTAGERTKILRFAHLEDPRGSLQESNPITIVNNGDFEKVEVMKRKENRMGSFSTANPAVYDSGHNVLRPTTGSHQDRLFIQNIKSNHIRYNNSSEIDEERIKYRETETSLKNFNKCQDISGDCPNVITT